MTNRGERKRPIRNDAESGMTLIEIMIAAGIMAIALVCAMGSLMSMSSTRAITQQQTFADATLSNVVENLRGRSYNDLLAYQPMGNGLLGNSESVQVVCFDQAQTAHTLPINAQQLAAPLPNPVEAQVTVFWRDAEGRPYTKRVSLLLGR